MLSLRTIKACPLHKENMSRQLRGVSAPYPMSRSLIGAPSRVKAKVAVVALAGKEDHDHEHKDEHSHKLPPYDLQEMIDYMAHRKGLVNEELDKIFAVRQPHKDLWEMIRYAILGDGKRIRPILCLATCEMLGGKTEEAMAAACAVEMIHNMSLVHDDLPCMDADEQRRGRATMWKQYGEASAVLAGDAMLIYPIEYLLDEKTGLDKVKAAQACYEIAKTAGINGLVGGQLVDIQNNLNSPKDAKKLPAHVLQELHINKTAKLLEASVICGAIMSGKADADAFTKLRKYSTNIGLAFQVIDDILDVVGPGDAPGGSGKDGESNVTTYPALYGVDKSRAIAYQLVEDAKQQVVSLGRDPKLTAPLIAIADYIITRKS